MSEQVELAPIDECVFHRGVLGIFGPHGTLAQAGLILAVIAGCAVYGLGSRWMGVPYLPNFDGSLLLSPSAFSDSLAIAVLMLVATLVGTFLAGSVRFEAGLFAGSLTLAIISLRSGTMQTVLFEANGSASAYYTLCGEIIVLSVMLLLLWSLLWYAGKAKFVKPVPEELRPHPLEDTPLAGNVAAMVTQALVTALAMLFLCQSEAKNQALASLAISSWVGAAVAYMCFPTRPSVWYWTGPLLCGLVGYVLAGSGQIPGLSIGDPQGIFAGIARPLPIDYASVGPAAAISAYWMMRKQGEE
jgi:hypothetical protein